MKRFITITTSALMLSLLSSCDTADVGIIGGADGPTAIYVTDGKNKAAVNHDGEKSEIVIDAETEEQTK